MENRTWKLAAGLALVLFATGLGGCQLLGSEKSSEANDSASDAPEAVIPVEKVQAETVAVEESPKLEKVVPAVPLTIPTDPDARIKAIRKGRSNPFAALVAPKSSRPETPKPPSNSSRNLPPSRSALGASQPRPKKVTPTPAGSSSLPRLSDPTASSNDIVLPPLPEPTLAKQVTVQGVMNLGGMPQAIVKAPNENVARTVRAGDSLAGGQIVVSSIDMSNPQSPKVILLEAGQTVTVGVGQSAEASASAADQGGGYLSASLPF